MRITKISVKKLFGIFDHEIPLNQESRITIVLGPNGIGKTVMLEMIHGLFHFDYELLERIPFEQFAIEFDSDEVLSVKGGAYQPTAGSKGPLEISVCKGSDEVSKPFKISEKMSRPWKAAIDEARPGLKTVHLTGTLSVWERYWVSEESTDDESSGIIYRVYTKEDLLREFPAIHNRVYGKMPHWFERIQEESDSQLISIGRLKRYPMRTELTTALYINEHVEQDELSHVVANPMDAVSQLRFFGLCDDKFRLLNEDDKSVSLFLDSVNGLLQHKEARYGAHGKLEIFSREGKEIQLETLSSGEQHVLILYHQLLFKIIPDTLVMIDEPELSMHVDWQERFLKDMQRIVALREFDLVIATHSPTLIDDKWEWMVGLQYPEQESS